MKKHPIKIKDAKSFIMFYLLSFLQKRCQLISLVNTQEGLLLTLDNSRWVLRLYWPQLIVAGSFVRLDAASFLTIWRPRNYRGIEFRLLGLGIGCIYSPKGKTHG